MTRKPSTSTRQRNSSSKSRPNSKNSSGRNSSAKGEALIHLSKHQQAIIAGIILIALCGVAILSGLSISRGKLTDWMWENIWWLFGWGGVVIPLLIGAAGLYLVLWGMEQPPTIRWERIVGAVLFFAALEGLLHLLFIATHHDPTITVEDIAAMGLGGGLLGGWLVSGLATAVGNLGALLLCLALVGIGTIMMTGLTWAQMVRMWRESRQQAAASAPARPAPEVSAPPAESAAAPAANRATPPAAARTEPPPPPPAQEKVGDSQQPGLFYGDAVRMAAANYVWQLPSVTDVLEPGTENAAADTAIREQVEIIEHTLASFGVPGRVVEINPGPVITQFGVEPQYIERGGGRRVKVKVGQISSLADDLALALAAQSIRIEAPVPGKGYVGIEVPNADVAIVSLRDVMESTTFAKVKAPLKIGLGQDVSGHAIATDLAQMPHLLIAGATGSGKSVCVNSIVACLLLNNSPNHLRMLMVDPKRVELTGYNGIPHLLTPVIVDLDKVVGTLQWVSREMDNRYRRFSEAGARNIADYNQQADEKLPYIVVVIDELADLMMMAPDEIERTVCRLAQMARATGIHLVIATQRPSVDVVTGLIKANFPARVAFAVASSTDSRVILDSTGAERLLGRGDMLLMTPETPQPQRLQGCYVSDRELRQLVEFWRKQRVEAVLAGKAAREEKAAEPVPAVRPSRPDAPAQVAEDEGGEETLPADAPAPPPAAEPEPTPSVQQPLWEELVQMQQETTEQDELMDEAVAIVRELGKASVSLLQRRLRIGYTRSARLIDAMEAQGIVGPHPGGSRQRDVLPPPDNDQDAPSTTNA